MILSRNQCKRLSRSCYSYSYTRPTTTSNLSVLTPHCCCSSSTTSARGAGGGVGVGVRGGGEFLTTRTRSPGRSRGVATVAAYASTNKSLSNTAASASASADKNQCFYLKGDLHRYRYHHHHTLSTISSRIRHENSFASSLSSSTSIRSYYQSNHYHHHYRSVSLQYFSTFNSNRNGDDDDDGSNGNGNIEGGGGGEEKLNIDNFSTNSSSSLLSLLSDEEAFTNASNDSSTCSSVGGDISDLDFDFDASTRSLSGDDSSEDKQQGKQKQTKKVKKKKRRKMKKPKPPDTKATKSSSTTTSTSTMMMPQQQSKMNGQILFDSIAPHVNETMMKQLLDDMDSFKVFIEEEMNLISREEDIDDGDGDGDSEEEVVVDTEVDGVDKKRKKKKKAKAKKKKNKLSQKDIREYKTTIGIIDAFIKTEQRGKKKKKRTKKNKVNDVDTNANTNAIIDPNTDCTWKDHIWIKSILAQFFGGAHFIIEPSNNHDGSGRQENDNIENEDTIAAAAAQPQTRVSIGLKEIWDDPKFTPNLNRNNYEKNVETLMRAREMSIESPLLWSQEQKKRLRRHRKKEKEMGQLQGSVPVLLGSENDINVHVALKEGGGVSISFDEEMKIVHNQKSPKILRYEAEEMAKLLADRLPVDTHKRVMSMFEEFAKHIDSRHTDSRDNGGNDTANISEEKELPMPFDEKYQDIIDDIATEGNSKKNPSRPPMKMLMNHLQQKGDFHMHLIAPEIACFLYVDVPWFKNETTAPYTRKLLSPSQTAHGAYQIYKTHGSGDPRIGDSWKCWLSMRDRLVKSFVQTQHSYCRLQKVIKEAEEQANRREKSKPRKSTARVGQSEKIMIKFSGTEHSGAEELLEELDMMRTMESGEKVGRDWKKEDIVKGRVPTKTTLRFECLMLNDRFGPYSNPKSSFLADIDESEHMSTICPEIKNQLPKTNRTIFVDNLPIDINEEELNDIYSRCGGIEEIEIFNLKPELDPGEPTQVKLKELRKMRRLSGGAKATKYERQRTPVYAIITFEDEDGLKSASNDMLRIFGMVIRRHPAKSHPARNFYKLHLENIPSGFYAIDIEEKLSKALHPDMYISLEIGQHVNSQPKNVDLTFPSFEVAHHAFQLLKKENFGNEECTLHWMRTPKDSMAYWTREHIVDP